MANEHECGPKFDDDGMAVAGTYPISTVMIGMWKADGEPMPTVTSAVCDVCGGWASNLWVSGRTTRVDESLSHTRVSRRLIEQVYACPTHSQSVADALVNEYGSACNAYDVDELAQLVDRHQRTVPTGEGGA